MELTRQVLSSKLPEIINLLIDFGADPNATMNVYGGKFTTIQLLSTSAHFLEAQDTANAAIESLTETL